MTANTTKIVSKNSNQQPTNYNSWYFDPPAISYDGRFASLTSAATNLGADMDGVNDIFVRDLISNTTILASQIISPTNNGRSKESAIASGGSYVAFSSTNSAMVVDDTNGKSDVFVNDGVEGTHMDLSISEVTPIQAVYTAKLVDGKSTAVRVVVEKLGASPLSNVQLKLEFDGKIFDEFSPSSYSAPDEPPAPYSQSILAVGTVISPNQATLDNWYVLPDGDPEWTESGDYTFEFRDSGGNLIDDFDVDISMALNAISGPQVYQLDQMPFAVILPYFDGTKQVSLKKGGTSLATKTVSANAPTVTLASPNGGEALNGLVNVTWSGSDLDGDDLEYSLLVSNDNGVNWATVQVGLSGSNYLWDTSLLPPGNQYRFKVIVTDGVNTSQDISQSTFTILKKTWLPLVHGK